LLSEDHKFYEHNGFNYERLILALVKNIFTMGKSGGASTISPQLAKILFTKHERKLSRKIYELFCTLELESKFTKNELLQIYLNSIYMGHGTYGIEDASNFYFGKDASSLTIAEASLFIGMNRSPEHYSPIKDRRRARLIQQVILNKFVEEGFISKDSAEFELNRFWIKFSQNGISGNQSFWKTEINRSAYITEYIRQTLNREFEYSKVTQGGLIVQTTIDLEKQLLAEKIVKDGVKEISENILSYVEKNKIAGYPENEIEDLEATLVSLDFENGDILALVGGKGYSYGNQLNRATYSYRQVGSAIKPFIYSIALMDGLNGKEINPFTRFKDEVTTYKINGRDYTPRNYSANHKYGEMVTLSDALKRSLNTIAVQVLNLMDIKNFANFINDITFHNDGNKRVPEVLALALGTAELSTLELARAYTIFPRGGIPVYPEMIKKITDIYGNVYYDSNRENNSNFNFLKVKKFNANKDYLSPQISYQMVQMLSGVFEEDGTAYWAARRANYSGNDYGKSGTTQDYKDGWFAGFNEREVAVVWVGKDNNKTIFLPSESNAALIWCRYMKEAMIRDSKKITIPNDITLKFICKDSELIATNRCPKKKEFYFYINSTTPSKCYIHPEDDIIGQDLW
jgi:penicillin-binding protein 1A